MESSKVTKHLPIVLLFVLGVGVAVGVFFIQQPKVLTPPTPAPDDVETNLPTAAQTLTPEQQAALEADIAAAEAALAAEEAAGEGEPPPLTPEQQADLEADIAVAEAALAAEEALPSDDN